MKKILFGLSLVMIMVSGCKQAKNEKSAAVIDMESRETPDFSKGVMDEKILWYLGRLGDVQVSPDGQTLLYTVGRGDKCVRVTAPGILVHDREVL